MNEENGSGIVYVLTNPAMPGIVKIGKTSRGDINARLNELYSTGVPLPFECAYAGKVEDEAKFEKAFHLAFGPYRVNAKREFFQIEPEQAITLLELMVIEDVTPDLQQEANSIDQAANEASKKLKSKRPNYNFKEMGIPIGSLLNFTQNQEEIVQVIDERKVLFRGNESSLTAATREILNNSYHVAPCPYWLYQGKNLRDIYNETYE